VSLPKSIGIKLYDDTFVPVLTEGEIKNKKLVLTTVKDNQSKAIIELYEGTSDRCINNEYLGKLVISIDRETVKGEPGIEVHLRLDEAGMLYAKAWDVETGIESTIKIESTATHRIHPETMSDNEIRNLGDSGTQAKIDGYDKTATESRKQSGDTIGIIKLILIVLIIAVIAGLVGVGLYLIVNNLGRLFKPSTTTTVTIPVTTTTVELTTTTLKNTVTTTTVKKLITTTTTVRKSATTTTVRKESINGVKNMQGRKHYIRRGDNLWNICKKYYKDPWYYPDLAKRNEIRNPRVIYAGTYLIIPDKSEMIRWDFSR
jgi:hypothetical protein